MRRTTTKRSSKISNKKVKYTFDTKSNVIMEDRTNPNTNVKFIFDADEPFYKHTFKKEQ